MDIDRKDLEKLAQITSSGINPEGDNIPEILGLQEDDVTFLVDLFDKVNKNTNSIGELFAKVWELTHYATDEIVKGFLMFHFGVTWGKKWAIKEIEEVSKERYSQIYKEGFVDGFKSGFKEGFKTAKDIPSIFKSEEED